MKRHEQYRIKKRKDNNGTKNEEPKKDKRQGNIIDDK